MNLAIFHFVSVVVCCSVRNLLSATFDQFDKWTDKKYMAFVHPDWALDLLQLRNTLVSSSTSGTITGLTCLETRCLDSWHARCMRKKPKGNNVPELKQAFKTTWPCVIERLLTQPNRTTQFGNKISNHCSYKRRNNVVDFIIP